MLSQTFYPAFSTSVDITLLIYRIISHYFPIGYSEYLLLLLLSIMLVRFPFILIIFVFVLSPLYRFEIPDPCLCSMYPHT